MRSRGRHVSLPDEHGVPRSYVLGTTTDVTAQHQAVLALRASEARYRSLFESEQGVVRLDDAPAGARAAAPEAHAH